MLTRSGLAVACGVLLSLAFEPVALPYVMPFAVAGFALSTRGLGLRAAWVPGLLFGVAFYFVHIWWMKGSIGTGAWVGLAGVEALFYGLVGAVSPLLHRLRAWPLWLAAAWTTMETVRSVWPFSGMPWGRLSFGVVDTPVAPALAYVGSTGLSFVLALLGFLLAWLVQAADGRRRLLAGGAIVGLVGLTVVPAVAPWTPDETGAATVAVVQGNVPGRGDDVLLDSDQLTDNHVQATIDLAAEVRRGETPAPDFVLWPENSTAVDPFEPGPVNDGIQAAAAAVGVPVVVGGLVDGEAGHVLNQGIVWDPVTGPGDRYTKWHPVAYGEYIPLRGALERLGLDDMGQLAKIPRDMVSGTRETPLRVAGIEVADAICFDIAYDDGLYAQLSRDAELLTVQTSNASFIFTDQIEQQFAITRLRAIESGRWLAVASTNGISGVVDPNGAVQAVADERETEVLVERVALVTGTTPAVRLGLWPGRVLGLVTAVGLVLGALALRRGTTQPAPAPHDDDVSTRPQEAQPA